jgi:hypothetical protein
MSATASTSEFHEWKDGSNTVEIGSGSILFNYQRETLMAKDQDRMEIKISIQKSLCEDQTLRQLISSGYNFIYNYIYQDGTITAVINNCD